MRLARHISLALTFAALAGMSASESDAGHRSRGFHGVASAFSGRARSVRPAGRWIPAPPQGFPVQPQFGFARQFCQPKTGCSPCPTVPVDQPIHRQPACGTVEPVVEQPAPAIPPAPNAPADGPPADDATGDEPADRQPPEVPAGAQIQLQGRDMGAETGRVVLTIGAISLDATIVEWTADSVTVRLPAIQVAQPTPATLQVLPATAEAGELTDILLVAAS